MGYPCPPENQTTLGWAWSTSTMKPQPVTVMEQCFGNVIGPSLLLTTCQTYLVGYITCYPSKYQLVWLHRLYHSYLGNLFGCSSCNAKLIPIVLPLGAIQREARWCKTPIGIDLNKSISIELFIYLIFTTMPEDGALTLDDRKQLIPWSHSSTGSMIAAWLFWPNARCMQFSIPMGLRSLSKGSRLGLFELEAWCDMANMAFDCSCCCCLDGSTLIHIVNDQQPLIKV